MNLRTVWQSSGRMVMGLVVASSLAADAGAAAAAAAPPPPTLTAPACAPAPFLDGVLTDACWRTAAVVTNFPVVEHPDTPGGHLAYVARDSNWLYVAFEVRHPAPAHLKQTVFEQDGAVAWDDAVEVSLDPGSAGAFYVHYQLNAANIKADMVRLPDGRDLADEPTPWRSATRMTETGWNAELAFPLHRISRYQRQPPCDWSAARLNLCVNRVTPIFDAAGVRMAEERQCSCWAPVARSYNEPECFGRLQGIRPDSESPALFLPAMETIQVHGSHAGEGRPEYQLMVTLRETGNAGGEAVLRVRDRPVGATEQETRQTNALAANQQQTAGVAVPLRTTGRRTAVIWVEDAEHGGAFVSRLLDEAAMQALDTFDAWLDRSYYTDASEAVVVYRLHGSPEALRGMRVQVKDQGGHTLGAADCSAPEARVRLPLKDVTVGRHPLTVEWVGADGARLAGVSAELVKLAPNPGCEVNIDRVNGVLLKDGRPFFPFGLYALGLTSRDEDTFRRIAVAGFNTLVWEGQLADADRSPAEYRAFLDATRRCGLMVVDWTTDIQPYPPVKTNGVFSKPEEVDIALADYARQLPALRQNWAVGRAAPNLLAQYNVDEPNLRNPHARIAVAERFYQDVLNTDPYHPVILLYAGHIPSGEQWTRWGDILAYDAYIYPGWDRFEYGTPNFVAQQTIALARRAAGEHKAVLFVPLALCMEAKRTPRTLRPEEQNCQTYLALIHGAKALAYFTLHALYTQTGWDTLSELAGHMRVLGPAVTAPAVPQQVRYSPGVLDADRRLFPDVQARLFRHPDGRYVLLAANSARHPAATTIRVEGSADTPGLDAGRPATGLFDGRSCAWRGAAFEDRLEGYGVRAYDLPLRDGARGPPAAGHPPLRITVATRAFPAETPPEPRWPVDRISRRRNVMPNPSFELMSNPGEPDYIRPSMYLTWPLVGAPGALWGPDTNAPFHGNVCLRLQHQFKSGEAPHERWRITTGVCYLPTLSRPTPYVFSVYARAAREGEPFLVFVTGDMTPPKPIPPWTLTRDWKRYWFSGTVRAGGPTLVFLGTFNKDAVVWIDAIQMEAGDAPTAFTME